MTKVNVITQGCSSNLRESELMMGLLDNSGYDVVNDENESDANVVNICTVKGDHTALREVRRLKKLNPKEAAKKLRTALGTSGTKIWSGKVKANVANWQRLVKNESAIPVGNSGRRFRTNTIKDSLSDTEEMFEQEIKLSESMKKELRELQKNASSDIAGEALKEAIDETLKKKKVRLDHVWIDHFPDGGGKIILTDYTGSFQWAHFSKSKLYETILRSELEELIPQAKDKNFTIQMIEYYWRQ